MAFPLLERFRKMQSDEQALLLHSRLNSFGQSAPKALTGMRPRKPMHLQPLSPELRKRIRPDAATSARSLRDPTMEQHSSKAMLAAGAELLNSSAPMPYAKMARHAPAPRDISDPDQVSLSEPMPIDSTKAGDERRDPFWFIRMLRTELSDHEFAYMNVADTDGTTWDPYNLKIVAFNEVNPENHYTISEAGVTHCVRRGNSEVAEFTPLLQWEEECALFHEVMEIPFFKRYQSWKAYTSWRRAIQSNKVSACSTVLTNHLFILNSTFQPSLLTVRKLCVELSQLKLHQVSSAPLPFFGRDEALSRLSSLRACLHRYDRARRTRWTPSCRRKLSTRYSRHGDLRSFTRPCAMRYRARATRPSRASNMRLLARARAERR